MTPSSRSRASLAAEVSDLDAFPAGAIPSGVPDVVSSRFKRLFDIFASAVLLVVLAPLMGMVALAVRLDSPGPILFRQPRVGLGGRAFDMLKFRTMRSGTSEEKHRLYVRRMLRENGQAPSRERVYKLVDDERVTAVGRLLRRTSIDELPQLWNVLRGEMSLVGPRPPLAYEVELYDSRQMRRLECRPGITGLWQVSGRNRLTYSEMCDLDLAYIGDWSPALDFSILLRTVPVVLTNSGGAQ